MPEVLKYYLQWAPAAAVYALNAAGVQGVHNFRERTILYGMSTAIMASTVMVGKAGVGILSTDLAYYLYPTVKRWFSKNDRKAFIAVPFYQQGVAGISVVHSF